MDFIHMFESYSQGFNEEIISALGRFIITLIALLFVLLFRWLINKSIIRKLKPYLIQTWRKNTSYVGWVIFLIIVIIIWLPHIRGFLTLFSIIGTGILIVTKDLTINILGWFYIMIRRPFEVGNRIMIQDYVGDVTDIRLMEFSMLEVKTRDQGGQSTGRMIRVPNGLLFGHPLANSSKEFTLYWNEITVPLSSDSNWKRAKSILEKTALKHLQQIEPNDPRLKTAKNAYAIFYNRTEPKIYTEVQNGQIILTLRHLSHPKELRDVSDTMWTHLLEEFGKYKDIRLV